MREFYMGAEWDVHEVRYVWINDGVFVRRPPKNKTKKAVLEGGACWRPLFFGLGLDQHD